MIRILVIHAFIATWCLASKAYADHCQQIQQAVQAISVQPVAIPVATQVVVPLYSAVYSPQQAQSLNDDLLRQLLEEIKALRADVQALKDVPPRLAITEDTVFQAMKTSCARCHTQGSDLDRKGGGLALFDLKGNRLKLDQSNEDRVYRRMNSNSMPEIGSVEEKKISKTDRELIRDAHKRK